MSKRKHIIFLALTALVAVFVFTKPALASRLIEPNLSIDIPGLSFTGSSDGSTVTSNFIAAYVTAFYKYLIGFSTTVAIVFIMIGGIMYAFGATSQNAISKAKERIRNAIFGLVLLMSVHVLMVTINPQLVIFRSLEIDTIDYVALIAASGDLGGAISTEQFADAGVNCPGSGDVKQIAESFIGKVTYRFGARGQAAPYPSETKSAPDGTAYSTFCPQGQICADCSGYVALVTHCAGLTPVNEAAGTASIFATAPKITSCGTNSVTLEDGSNVNLAAGDLVGFKSGDMTQFSGGHVWMYIGDGMLINSVGRGRAEGTAILRQSLKSACNSFSLRLVDRP